MISAAALVFAVNILSSVLKKWVKPSFGKLGVQVTVFVLAAVGALYSTYNGSFPALKDWAVASLGVFSLSVAFYEVILSRISLFKGKKVV